MFNVFAVSARLHRQTGGGGSSPETHSLGQQGQGGHSVSWFNSRKPLKHVRSPSSCEWAELPSNNTLRYPLHEHRQPEAIEEGGADHYQSKHASTATVSFPLGGAAAHRLPPSIPASTSVIPPPASLSKNKKVLCLTLIGFLLTNHLTDNRDIRKLHLKRRRGPKTVRYGIDDLLFPGVQKRGWAR